jgi:hypothetical protein
MRAACGVAASGVVVEHNTEIDGKALEVMRAAVPGRPHARGRMPDRARRRLRLLVLGDAGHRGQRVQVLNVEYPDLLEQYGASWG